MKINAPPNATPASPVYGSAAAVARLIAFYLPQFHPIPENDAWWGKGFTEWTNVAKARSLYRGHWQPHLPADLGFYDLRLPEVREAQAALARDCGVEGFCYWHYWFGEGRRIIERPFEEVLNSGQPRLPFCLAWANESWSGIWHGNPKSILIEQKYPGPQDELAHFNLVLPAFRDSRYLCVDGKPIFVIFKPHGLPSTQRFIEHWRTLAHRAGLPGLYFVAISNVYKAGVDRYRDAILAPFDAVTPLAPQDYPENLPQGRWARMLKRFNQRDFGHKLNRLTGQRLRRPLRYDYADVVDKALNDMPAGRRYLPCVLPNWDNTPRSAQRGMVYENATPELFGRYLQKAIEKVAQHPRPEAIVFLKAWNEWAEGNYVEPDHRFGHAYLDTIKAQMYPGR